MQSLTYSDIKQSQGVIDDEIFVDAIKSVTSTKLDNAFRYRYHTNDKQQAIIQSFFPDRYVLPHSGDGYKYRTSNHPILAVLNDYCNEHANSSAASAMDKGKIVITIGDSTKPKITHKKHNCILLDSAREAYRVASTQINNGDHTTARGFLAKAQDNESNPGICVNGAEKCKFKANIAFSVHSFYDITPKQVAQIFEAHGLEQMMIYMYIPLMLYGAEYKKIDELAHNIQELQNDFVFSMQDSSIPYIHSKENWKTWANFTSITYGSHRIIRENVLNRGPLYIINLVKIGDYKGDIYMSIPLTRVADKFYLVPSIKNVAHLHYSCSQKDVKHHLVPKHVVDQLISYTVRQADEAYKYVELATVASGLLREIKIGSQVYASRWECSPSEYHDITLSLFIIGAIQRADRTSLISKTFKHLQAWGKSDGIAIEFRDLIYSVVNFFQEDYAHKEERDNRIAFLRVKEISSSDITKDIKVDLESTTIKSHVYEHDSLSDEDVESSDEEIESTISTPSVVLDLKVTEDASENKFHDELVHKLQRVLDAQRGDALAKFQITNNDKLSDTTNMSRASIKAKYHLSSDSDSSTSRDELASTPTNKTHTVCVSRASVMSKLPPDNSTPTPTKELVSLSADSAQFGKGQIKSFMTDAAVNKSVQRTVAVTIRKVSPPSRFQTGHCMMQAFWNSLPLQKKPRQADLIKIVYDNGIANAGIGYTQQNVEDYIMRGNYNNPFCDFVFEILARVYMRHVVIHNMTDRTIPNIKIGDVKMPDSNVYYTLNHYSHLPTGGIITKSDTIDKIASLSNSNHVSVIDLSGAPGHIIKSMNEDKRFDHITEYTLCHYKSGLPLIKNLPNNVEVVRYEHVADLKKLANNKYDIIICDIQRTENSEAVYNSFIPFVKQIAHAESLIVFNTFGNPIKLWEFITYCKSFDRIPINDNKHAYFIVGPSDNKTHDIFDIYDKYALKITNHETFYDPKAVGIYIDAMFKTIMHDEAKNIKEIVKNVKLHSYTISALTGYASASKTTYAIKEFSQTGMKTVFIAPTRHLAIKHNNLAVRSFTPHNALFNIKDATHIIVDEFTQLHLEYIHLVHALNSEAKIIVLGDVHQTHAIDYDNKKFRQIKTIGIVNNLWDVYMIPKDITNILNLKFGYHIRTQSNVEKAMCYIKEGINEVIKLGMQIITFNDSTCKEIIKNGGKCSTITTYQGDRCDTVVFYIDSKSVTSQLINRTEWVYTGLTRSIQQMVICGATQYLSEYLMINGNALRTLEEISNVKLVTDTYNVTMESNRSELQMQTIVEQETVEDITPPIAAVLTIVQDNIKPENEATKSTAFLQPEELPAVESGALKTNLGAILHKHRTFKGYKYIPNVPMVRNQVSNDAKDTIRTLIKRYSKKMPRINDTKNRVNTNSLLNSFVKAIYGNDHSMHKFERQIIIEPEELRRHARGFLHAAQLKTNSNPSYARELQEQFDHFDETIAFVNKRQCKFDAESGFDTKDKVGQGVASMSKRVNFIMCAYSRALLYRVREIARSNGHRIVIATFDSDEELNNEFTKEFQTCEKRGKWACADVSEWDSMFQKFMAGLTYKLCDMMGMPKALNEWFLQMRSSWRLVYHTPKDGNTKLMGEGKQFSGNPFTICENTICNMALMFYVHNYKNVQMSVWKGDDSAVYCDNVTICDQGKEMLAETKHKLKSHFQEIGEFAGYILTEYGMFPDLLRYTAKFLGKVYKNQDHFNEARANTKACTVVVKSQSKLNYCCVAYTALYPELNINAEQSRILFNFLNNADKIKFEDLKEVEEPVASV